MRHHGMELGLPCFGRSGPSTVSLICIQTFSTLGWLCTRRGKLQYKLDGCVESSATAQQAARDCLSTGAGKITSYPFGQKGICFPGSWSFARLGIPSLTQTFFRRLSVDTIMSTTRISRTSHRGAANSQPPAHHSNTESASDASS